jgi:hypothetical protein
MYLEPSDLKNNNSLAATMSLRARRESNPRVGYKHFAPPEREMYLPIVAGQL